MSNDVIGPHLINLSPLSNWIRIFSEEVEDQNKNSILQSKHFRKVIRFNEDIAVLLYSQEDPVSQIQSSLTPLKTDVSMHWVNPKILQN